MVNHIINFGRNGVQDWLIQRISAVILAIYTLFLFGFFLTHREIDYWIWQQFFSHPGMQIFTFAAVLSLVLHVWVGVWVVITDYIRSNMLRVMAVVVLMAVLGLCVGWAIRILW